jgi:aspartyl-tRNA(Asn)/glutamyl-tRNA(Gln) amidotransferase subunit C
VAEPRHELTRQDVKAIAELARLQLTDAEVSALTGQLGAIIHYVDQLAKLDTTDVEPLGHALDVHNVFRDDEPAPSLTPEEALANAPAKRVDGRGQHFYAVPAVQE